MVFLIFGSRAPVSVGSLSVVASRRVRRRRRPKSGPILREWSAKNTTLAWIFQSPTSILARTRLKSVNFAPAAGRLTKNLLRPLRFSIFGGRWRPARQVVFLPPKSGIYHLSVPQPPARSVPWDLHTGNFLTLPHARLPSSARPTSVPALDAQLPVPRQAWCAVDPPAQLPVRL